MPILNPDGREGGSKVLKVDRLVIGYNKPLSEVSFELKKGQRLAVLGENGIGKSTLLKTLVGQLKQLNGAFTYGFQIDMGYFDQQLAQITNDKTVLENFCDEFPEMLLSEVRTALGCFLFTQDAVYKKVCQLSGGEKVRLYLAKMLKKRPNLLVLDEPTNHMDIVGKEALEAMIKSYSGTVLFVSHDRYFVQEIADSLLVFEKNGVHYYPFGYQGYAEKELGTNNANEENKPVMLKNTSKAPGEKEREKRNQDRDKQMISRLEAMMEEAEKEIDRINVLMQKPEIACDYIQLNELNDKLLEEECKLEEYLVKYEQYCEVK